MAKGSEFFHNTLSVDDIKTNLIEIEEFWNQEQFKLELRRIDHSFQHTTVIISYWMDKQLICSLCNQQYKQNNVPRLLPKCGHSFCESCIKTSLTPAQSGDSIKIVCPEDNQQMLFDDQDINNFPKNIALIKLLTKDSKKKDESFKDSSLNESNIAKHSVNEADQQDKELITAINESTKGIDSNRNLDNPSEDLELNLQDMCLIHQKPLEIVCIRDKTKICSTCAIFGDHKGHQFKSLDEVAKDKQKRCDGILNLIDQKEALQTKVTGKETKQQLSKTLATKKEVLSKEIKDRFSKITESIKATEKKALQKVAKGFTSLEQKLKQDIRIPETTNKKYLKWQQRAYHQIQAFDGHNNFFQQLKLLNYDKKSQQLDIIEQGEKIMDELDKCIQTLEDYKSESLGSITIEWNGDLQKKISELLIVKQNKKTLQMDSGKTGKQPHSAMKFKEIYDEISPPRRLSAQSQQQPIYVQKVELPANHHPHNHNPDDDLLGVHEVVEQSQPMVIQIKDQIPIIPLSLKQPEVSKPVSMTTMLTPTSMLSPPDTARKMGNSGLKDTSFNFEKAPIKKKPKIKLPQKYQKILDGIINDQLETVDFTNAQLGDQVMAQIMECMKGRKVKTLKLIRNKLTDEGLDKMLPCFGNIITLNLSQNLLTDRFIDQLITSLPKLPNLKSLILSQNKIKERNVKGRLEEIKKCEIVVSL